MAVDAILERLLALHPKKIDLSLGRMHRILAALGHPERQVPPVIHVAGTNGKGSVLAYLRAMAEAAGKTVHVYTSPHLVRFNERIRLAGRLISDDHLSALLAECEEANGEAPITFFEITTAAAFLAFSRVPADLLLMEVGLGGRLDATNVIDHPLASVITPVSLDHQEFLGSELAGIAAEKAGILKPDAPGVVARQPDVVRQTVEERAGAVGAPLFIADRDWTVTRHADSWRFADSEGQLSLPAPALAGAHQMDNAALALAAARCAGLALPESAIAEGMRTAHWPARMQTVTIPGKSGDWPGLIDGGHNPAAAAALATAIADLPETAPGILIIGMLANRDITDFLTPLRDHIGEVWAVPLAGHDCHSPETIAAAAEDLGLSAERFPDMAAAFARLRETPPHGRAVIAGSLYAAGEALDLLGLLPD